MKSRTVIGSLSAFLCCLCALAFPPLAAAQQAAAQIKQPPRGSLAAPSSASPSAPQPPLTPSQKEEQLGDLYLIRKNYHLAIRTYSDVLSRQPRHARIRRSKLLNKIGICYQELDLPRQAQKFYKKAAKTDKHFASPQNNLGTIDFGRRNYKGAIKHFRKAVKIEPQMAAAFSNLGYAFMARKKYKKAILAFRRAILIDPSIFQNRSTAGSVVEQPGNNPPGLFYYMLAKTFATLGDAKSCAHYLKMSRDEGYKKYTDALHDPAFKVVLKDPRVHAILFPKPNQAASTATVISRGH